MYVAAADEECWEQSGTVCRFVYDTFDQNEGAANFANWFVDIPLQVMLVLAIAWVATGLSRRWVKRFVDRVVDSERGSTSRLDQMGFASMLAADESEPRSNRATSISIVLTSTIVVTIWVIALLMVLGIIGINLGPLLAGAGIAGVALGFGAQSLVKDCIAGLFMLIEDQFGIGDVVDLGEAVGVVEEITLRATVLRSIDGTVWHVPNGVVQRVGNFSQLWSVAVVDVDVAYDSDLEQTRTLLEEAATEVTETEPFNEHVIDPPTVLGVEALAADGITIRVITKVQPGAQWDVQRAMRQRIKEVFDEAGIEIPFPQRTVWMRVPNDGTQAGTGDDHA